MLCSVAPPLPLAPSFRSAACPVAPLSHSVSDAFTENGGFSLSCKFSLTSSMNIRAAQDTTQVFGNFTQFVQGTTIEDNSDHRGSSLEYPARGLPILKTFSKNSSWGRNGESRVKASWSMSSSSLDTAEGTPPHS
ncbi:hypothetical protein F5876DRAFT_85302 [Lentinula aff. lateritia]|uniref:Uncharacterized protein n=1 Tax=Lentinula aff. lateritia TaxID=2804960 RepID=A0ACC1TFX3_9AGAR|nr:hypothetical protein F5876DRAFT_85302 [Lentinula aff. lateritia]